MPTQLTFCSSGSTTSSTTDFPALCASLAARLWGVFVLEGDDGVDDVLPSRLRRLPTYSSERRRDRIVSTFFTGRIVSTPLPMSASPSTVPEATLLRAAYEARREERTEPV